MSEGAELTITEAEQAIVDRAQPHTMTSPARLLALIDAVRHCARHRVEGGLVECGVWRGGSMLAVALTLIEASDTDRDLYLFDTFEGMTAPGEHDVSDFSPPAIETWREASARDKKPWSEYFGDSAIGEDAVRALLVDSGYPERRIHLVPGPVERTLPSESPEQIALLRLDTDWYESTRHELIHLYPRLVRGGVLIIDDYGHWQGCRRAVDEYFAGQSDAPLLHRIDYTGRIGVRP